MQGHVARLSRADDVERIVSVRLGQLLANQQQRRRAVRDRRAVEQTQRPGDDGVGSVVVEKVHLVCPGGNRLALGFGARNFLVHDLLDGGAELGLGI